MKDETFYVVLEFEETTVPDRLLISVSSESELYAAILTSFEYWESNMPHKMRVLTTEQLDEEQCEID